MRYIVTVIFSIVLHLSSSSQILVLPGDHPDPSVVKIGDTYWGSATTSNWLPAFPILKSKDLVNWTTSGNIFDSLPPWADFYFWAPEITFDNGKIFVYYAAHQKKGNLCIAVASADKPEGPYRDHGPLMCQDDGSIDAFPMRDENGKLYLIWKEDGNSVGLPTPIWAMEMKEDRTALIGEKKQLFKNSDPWEGSLVEGVSMMRHGEYFYAFYAAAACCGRECSYKSGIARSKKLLGPWEKYEKNPILFNNDKWICPGHGTPIEKDGRFYFLYHGYEKKSNVYTGRQGLLNEFKFTPDGWVEFTNIQPDHTTPPLKQFNDDFKSTVLANSWEWSVFQKLNYHLKDGRLQLAALPDTSGAFVAQKTMSADYKATTLILTKNSTASAGIAVIGNEYNIVSALFNNGKIIITQVKEAHMTDILEKTIAVNDKLYLRMQVKNGREIIFMYSVDGRRYIRLNNKPIDGSFLPPWDRAIRVGLVSKGDRSGISEFEDFELAGM